MGEITTVEEAIALARELNACDGFLIKANESRDLPELAEKMSLLDWEYLIGRRPEFATHFIKYGRLAEIGSDGWLFLLVNNPLTFAPYCQKVGGYEKINGGAWAMILKHHPEFAPYCQKVGGFDKIDAWGWTMLLKRHPEFTSHCLNASGSIKTEGWGKDQLLERLPELGRTRLTLPLLLTHPRKFIRLLKVAVNGLT